MTSKIKGCKYLKIIGKQQLKSYLFDLAYDKYCYCYHFVMVFFLLHLVSLYNLIVFALVLYLHFEFDYSMLNYIVCGDFICEALSACEAWVLFIDLFCMVLMVLH